MHHNYFKYSNKIKEKHQMGVLRGLIYELVIRAYINPQIRACVNWSYPVRKPQKHWAFLLGCYNSGTTILKKIIGYHPEISVLPREGERFTSIFPDLNENGWIRMIMHNLDKVDLDPEQYENLAKRAIKDWSPWWKDSSIFLEKSITHSVRIKSLEHSFGSPKFIAIVRNGYCVAEGIRRRARPRGAAKLEIGEKYPMDILAEQWVYINQKIRIDSASVNNIYFVKYEEFISSPVDTLTSIFEFLEVEPINLEFRNEYLSIGDKKILIKKTNQSSISRLSEKDIEKFNQVARDELVYHGYKVLGA